MIVGLQLSFCIEKNVLTDREIENQYAADAHAVAFGHLAEVRRLIKLLPVE